MLHFNKAGITRIASRDFIDETVKFIQKIGAPPQQIGGQLLLLQMVRTLTGTENDPGVSDAEIEEFIEENGPEVEALCSPYLETVQILNAGKQVH